MKLAIAIVGLLAVLALPCGSVLAQSYTGGIFIDNTDNTSMDPHATTNGLFWIDTGSGPALLDQDIDMQVLCGGAPTTMALLQNPGYTPDLQNGPQYSTWLISDGTATDFGQKGMGDGTFLGGGLVLDPFGNELVTYQQSTLANQSDFYFQLMAWTGDYNTYTDAYAASAAGTPGIYIGDTPVFINGTATSITIAPDLTSMPAVILQRGLMGDANYDGKVDINDLTIVLAHYGQTGMTWADGEFTGDGTVDINDLTIVLAHYNDTLEAAAGGSATAVPEPCAVALAVAGLIGFAAFVATKRGKR
jgi:hypothetical protein